MKLSSVILCLCIALVGWAGCGSDEVTPTPAPELIPTLTSTHEAVSTVVVEFSQEEVRALGLAYWDAFNSYDLDGLLSYLEPTYRDLRKDTLAQEMGQMRSFSVKLGVTVVVEPEDVGEGEVRMLVDIKNPLDIRRVLMTFQTVDNEWKITYAQEIGT